MFYTTDVEPPDYGGGTQDLSIHDLIGEMCDPTKTVYVEIKNKTHLTFVVDGYTAFEGDICHLQDYSSISVARFREVMCGNGWEYALRYTISHIGHKTLAPIRLHIEKWLRW